MLGKLLKYDIKSMYRTFFPLWGVILALAAITRLLENIPSQRQSLGDILDPQTIALIVFVSVFIAVMVIAAILIVQRFYKGLLRDEGYLMFTLPVPAWKLVLSKLLCATGVCYLSMVVGYLSILILAGGPEWDLAWRLLFYSQDSIFTPEVLWMSGISILLAPFATVLHVYLSMAIGHLAKKHRIGASIGTFLGLNIVINIISTQISSLFFATGTVQLAETYTTATLNDLILQVFPLTLTLYLLQIIAFFACTVLILKKHLNLE